MADARRTISYPDSGNDVCYSIEEASFWYRHRNKCISEALKAFPPPGPLFDVGGGNGFVAAELQRQGQEVCLVEPGRQGALNAQKRGLTHIINSSLEDAGFKPAVLPAVGLFDVLEHIEDDCAFLRLVQTVLEPGGRLYISVPAFRFLWSHNDEHLGHFRRYTLASLQERLEKTGFRIEYASYIFRILPLPIYLTRTLPGKLGLSGNISPRHKRREHGVNRSRLRALIERSLVHEVLSIRRRKLIRFGASCLVVATKS